MKRQLASLSLVLLTSCAPATSQTTNEKPAAMSSGIPPAASQNVQSARSERQDPIRSSHSTRTLPSKSGGSPTTPSVRAIANKNLPPLGAIRGIFVTQATFQGSKMPKLLAQMKRNGWNALVVDVKDDNGHVTLGPGTRRVAAQMKRNHVYLIARIVVFKDPSLARKRPDLAIHRQGGGMWTQKGVPWVDPYRRTVWQYNVGIAKRATALGFDEIQWDYVRFPDASRKLYRSAQFSNPKHLSKSDDITQFLQYARRQLPSVRTSADVFGLVTTAADDMGIGQVWEKISPNVDAISPMMYPSHYSTGSYGLLSPESAPHQTIERGLRDAVERNRALQAKGIHAAVIRPWLQDFDMRVDYTKSHVHAQVRAAKERGVQGYLLWNQANTYSS